MFPKSIQSLIDSFSLFPTVGPKTAERFALHLLNQEQNALNDLARQIASLKEKTTLCQSCLAIADQTHCQICANKNRDSNMLCVVTDWRDITSIENTRQYHGYYFCLGKTLNAIEGVHPDQLPVKKLIQIVQARKITEIILALAPDFEGETTALYLTRILKPLNIKITRLARGLPMGANLEYADEITLGNAMKYRNEI